MKFEFSAGGVVLKPISKTQDKKEYLVLLAQHAIHHGWVFPKGIIGDHPSTSSGQVRETKEQAAIREVEEETGVLAKLGSPLTPVTYWYEMDGIKRKKTVYYFLMEYISEDVSKKDNEMENVAWIPFEEVANRLTYPSDKKIWQEAQKLI